jgi:hypothetical protein
MQTETTKKREREREKKTAHTHTQIYNKRQEQERERDEFITVERRGIECRARMRKLCLSFVEKYTYIEIL